MMIIILLLSIGTLALWSCCLLVERDLPFQPTLCVAIAPIGDLEEGQRRRLSDDGNAIQIYMGGQLPSDNNNDGDDPYKLASPSRILPLMVPCILVGGDKDEDGMNIFIYENVIITHIISTTRCRRSLPRAVHDVLLKHFS